MRSITARIMVIAALGVASQAATSPAAIIQSASGLSSAGVPVAFEAHLSIVGDNLTIDLYNVSPVNTLNPNDLLCSYYFDIVNNLNVRPVLGYQSAIGPVWQAVSGGPDILINPAANLKATVAGDNTWQFRNMNAALSPFLGFGIGTVGNNNLTPNNFMGNIVDGRDYGIYKGEVTTANLNGTLLVKEHATYTFTGLTGFTEANISPQFAFGLGTAPDSLLTPEPATLALLVLGALGLRRTRR